MKKTVKTHKHDIVFLIRAYNEGNRICSVLEEILWAGYHHLLIVDDGSTDDTKEKLSHFKDITYIHHPFNRWGGAALETGFEYLRRYAALKGWKYVVTFDADGQHRIDDLHKFIHAFEKHPHLDIVFGSRFIIKTNTNVPFIRKMILKGGILFTYLMSQIHLTDSHNGYRMIRTASLDKIRLTMNGMEYASEMIEQISQNKLAFSEVPVNIHYDDYTLGKGQRFGGAMRIALKMIFSKFFK